MSGEALVVALDVIREVADRNTASFRSIQTSLRKQ